MISRALKLESQAIPAVAETRITCGPSRGILFDCRKRGLLCLEEDK